MNSLTPSKGKTSSNGDVANRSGLPVFNQFRQELDQVFSRFFGDLSFFNGQKPSWGVDLEEKDDSVIARFEAPGFDAKEVELKQVGNELVLKAEHKTESKDKDRSEEKYSSLYRSITLPPGVNFEKAEARFQNGLLTVAIPKGEAAKGKRIAIQTN